MRFSVVIPAFNDQDSLNRTVSSIRRQTVSPHEIIIVDDGSDKPLIGDMDAKMFRIDRDAGERGSSTAKNLGASMASGDWLVFSDDDIIHAEDAFESIELKLNTLRRDDILVNVFSIVPGQAIDHARVELVKHDKSVFSEQHCGVIRRDYFDAIGGYDSTTFLGWGYNNQDLSLRVKRAGGIITSNVISVKTGELLTCVHTRPSIHDSTAAKSDFRRKYGRPFNVNMLIEETRAAS